MKRKMTLSLMLTLSMLFSLVSFAATAQGQQGGRRLIADTGVIRLGSGQILRITINGQSGNDTLDVSFRRTYYVGSANGGVWRAMIASQDTTAPVTVSADEAVSVDMTNAGFDGVRIEAIIRGYTGTTTVNAGVLQIINSDGSVATATNLLATTFGR